MTSSSLAVCPKGTKLYQVSSGTLKLNKAWLTAMRDFGKMIDIPVAMYMIEHPNGLVIFDTGVNPEVAQPNDPHNYWGGVADAFFPTVTREEIIDKQVEKIGHKAEHVKYVIYSHFHLDHVGGIELFPNATHIAQKEELKTAWWPEPWQRPAFVQKDFDDARNFNYNQLEGDWDLFGDGCITIMSTPGHTQGHESVIVRLPKTGTVVLTGDAAYLPENLQGALPGIVWNPEKAMDSIEKFKWIRDRENGQVWFSHDPEQYNAHKHPPEFYE